MIQDSTEDLDQVLKDNKLAKELKFHKFKL